MTVLKHSTQATDASTRHVSTKTNQESATRSILHRLTAMTSSSRRKSGISRSLKRHPTTSELASTRAEKCSVSTPSIYCTTTDPHSLDEIDTVLPMFGELHEAHIVDQIAVSNYRIDDIKRAMDPDTPCLPIKSRGIRSSNRTISMSSVVIWTSTSSP